MENEKRKGKEEKGREKHQRLGVSLGKRDDALADNQHFSSLEVKDDLLPESSFAVSFLP